MQVFRQALNTSGEATRGRKDGSEVMGTVDATVSTGEGSSYLSKKLHFQPFRPPKGTSPRTKNFNIVDYNSSQFKHGRLSRTNRQLEMLKTQSRAFQPPVRLSPYNTKPKMHQTEVQWSVDQQLLNKIIARTEQHTASVQSTSLHRPSHSGISAMPALRSPQNLEPVQLEFNTLQQTADHLLDGVSRPNSIQAMPVGDNA